MPRTLTITLPDDVYDELRRRAGQDDVSTYIQQLVSPPVYSEQQLEAEYRAMAADEDREREALEWIEAAPDDALS
ncbi:MAG TPA: addiction module antitoxin [Chloroflexota bacterium]|nr:addiction module antitoxin [Chloroflexota bacterium]